MSEFDRKAYAREYNQRPEVKARAAQRMRRSRAKWSELIREARSKPCVDCGEQLPVEIMEFDHVRGTKRFHFCHAASTPLKRGESREQVILAEIKKCEVRCPNCHKMRHYRESSGHFAHRATAQQGVT